MIKRNSKETGWIRIMFGECKKTMWIRKRQRKFRKDREFKKKTEYIWKKRGMSTEKGKCTWKSWNNIGFPPVYLNISFRNSIQRSRLRVTLRSQCARLLDSLSTSSSHRRRSYIRFSFHFLFMPSTRPIRDLSFSLTNYPWRSNKRPE